MPFKCCNFLLFNPQIFQYIFALVQFWVGKDNGYSFTLIQYKIILFIGGQFLNGIVHPVLYWFYQFLSFFKKVAVNPSPTPFAFPFVKNGS